MMRLLILLAALIVGGIITIHTVLQNGSLQRYLDEHPDPRIVPQAEYVIAHGYYLMGDLEQSATYFLRISERYPKSDYSDDAYYYYLQSLDDMNTPRQAMADLYQTYVDRFPSGAHFDMVSRRVIMCRNSR